MLAIRFIRGDMLTRIETKLGYLDHLDQPSHILSRSSGSDPVYNISGSDTDSALDYLH